MKNLINNITNENKTSFFGLTIPAAAILGTTAIACLIVLVLVSTGNAHFIATI